MYMCKCVAVIACVLGGCVCACVCMHVCVHEYMCVCGESVYV